MKDYTELLHVAVSVLLTAVVIIAGVVLMKVGSNAARNLTNFINTKNTAVEEAAYTKYANGECTGSDVVSAIRKYRDSVVITVITKNGATGQKNFDSTNSALAGSFQNIPTSEFYINPGAFFTCEVQRASNDNISGLKFTQTANLTITQANINAVSNDNLVSISESSSYSLQGYSTVSNDGSYDVTESSVDDLELLFSDSEADKKSLNNSEDDEVAQYVKDLSNAIMNYSSQLDDLVQELSELDLSEVSTIELSNLASRLQILLSNLNSLSAKCNSSFLTVDLQEKYKAMLETVKDSLLNAMQTVEDYKQQMLSLRDSENVWHIGSPVKENVTATLSDGVLTFTGVGDADTGHSLPKWLYRKKEIVKVVFDVGVSPVNIDYWFSGCINLKEVKFIPDSVQSMNGVFFGCKNLSGKLVVGDFVSSANAFREKGNMTLTVVATGGSQTMETFNEYLALETSKDSNVKFKQKG